MLLISIMVSWVIWGNLSVETTKLTVTSKDLPEAFDKFSIAHISDLHNAEYGKNNEKLIDILEAESPNIIAITGDLIDSNHTNPKFVERFPELSLFFKAYSLLDSEMICIFPYLCPYAESAREIREIFS